MLLLACFVAHAQDISTGALEATLADDQLAALAAVGGPEWLEAATPLYSLNGAALTPTLSAEALPDGQLLLRLALENETGAEVQADVDFPAMGGLGTDSSEDLGYWFPALGTILDDAAATHRRYYSGLFPLQVMELHQGEAGLWLLVRDEAARAKTFNVSKDSYGKGGFVVEWPDLVVGPGETVVLEASLGAHDSDWHAALDAYRRWARTWYQPAAAPKATFREAFNLRQIHLHDNSVLGDHPGAFDPDTDTFSIADYVAEDVEQLGGVDWVHIFDWGMDWIHGRVGDYNPWSYLGPPELLQAQVDALQADGIGVGLYVEGYLLDTPSLVGLSWGDAWEMQNSSGGVYTNYAPSWHVCAAHEDWRAHFALRNGRRTELRVGADGLYVDQHGYGYQYKCYRDDHGHAVPGNQLQAELGFMEDLRVAMSPDQVLYTEAAPVDVVSQWQDGAFTEAVSSFRYDSRTVPVAIRRFGLPWSKTFELLTQDAPLDDDVEGVRLAFFNGEGIRHMGYYEDEDWFSDQVLAEIRQAWGVLRAHREALTGPDPVPLVDTELDGVYANLFQSDSERVWTLLNRSDAAVAGPVLRIDSVPGATWRDCWNDVALSPETEDGLAVIEVALPAGEVGCVVETRPEPAASLVAHWALDATSGTTVEDAVGDADGTVEGAGATLGLDGPSDRHATALSLDGSAAVSLGEVAALAALTADYSLSAWVWPDSDEGVMRILAVDGWDDGGLVFGLTRSGGRRALVLTTVGEKDYVLPVVIPTDRWSHVAVVLDAGASAHFYVDGELRGTVEHDTPGTATGNGWWLGSNGTDGAWSGRLDDVRVYDGALTRAELRALADVAPPLVGWVRAPEEPWTDAEALTLWWPGFWDPGSGVAGYQVALGSTAGGEDLLPWTDVGTDQQGELSGLDLPEGTVHVTVRAIDGVGQQSEVQGTVEVAPGLPALLGAWTFEEGVVDEPVLVDDELERLDDFTVTAWVAPAATGFQAVLGSDSAGWFFGLGGEGGDDLVLVTMGLEEYVVAADVPLDGWSHVAVVFDRYSDARFYLDGELVGRVHGTLPAAPSESGYRVGGQAFPWTGLLDDVRLYDGALSSDQVAAIFDPEGGDTGDTGHTGDGGTTDGGGTGTDGGTTSDGGTAEDGGTADGGTGDGGAVEQPKDEGCGCSGSGSLAGGLWLGLLGLWARRRSG